MKTLLIIALSCLFVIPECAAARQQLQQTPTPEDFTIVSDRTESGVRTIVAIPSPLVCSRKIEIKVDAGTDIIRSVVFTRGCNGNLKAVNVLLQGMSVKDAVAKLDGIMCGNRGTSCTDQLARVLKACYKLQR